MRGRLEVETAERTLRSSSFPPSSAVRCTKVPWLARISMQSSQPFAASNAVPIASFFVRSPVRRLRLKQLPQMAQGKNLHAHSARRRRRGKDERGRGRERRGERPLELAQLAGRDARRSLGRSVGKFAAVKITRRRRRRRLRHTPSPCLLSCQRHAASKRSIGWHLARSLALWLESVACPHCLLSLPPYLAPCLSVMRQCVFFVFS